MSNRKFLEKCQKAFKDKDLIRFNGLYPFNIKIKRDGLNLTNEQLFFCNLILKTGLPFVIEKKINAPEYHHFYIDILVKSKFHWIAYEIDGNHHYTNKAQRIRDLKKAIYLLKYHEIITIRVSNEKIHNYKENPEKVDSLLNFLYIKLFNRFNKHKFLNEQNGELKKELREIKDGKKDKYGKKYKNNSF